MKRAFAILLFPLLVFSKSAGATGGSTKYLNGFWLQNSSFVRTEKIVRNGRFSVEGNEQIDNVVDLKGGYVIPSLGEAHNHNLQNCHLVPDFAKAYVEQGILYSAQLFATDPALASCKSLFGKAAVPSVAFARIGVTSSTGHPIGFARDSARAANLDLSFDQITSGMLIADSRRELEEKWAALPDKRTDFVKVILIDAVNSARNFLDPSLNGYNGVTPEVLRAVVRQAHESNLRVIAHVDTAEDFAFAVDAGVDTIGHLPGYRIEEGKRIEDYRLSEVTVSLAARRNIAVIPTMAAASYYLQVHPEATGDIRDNYMRNLKLLKRFKVTVLTGSDRFEGSVIDEIRALATTGLFTPMQLIEMSAVASPRWMFPNRKVGCLENGCEATFNVYDRNPSLYVRILANPQIVVRMGDALKNIRLKRRTRVDAQKP